MPAEAIRVRTNRVIYYQGNRSWVEGCLSRAILGTMKVGEGRYGIGLYVTGTAFVKEEVPPIEDIRVDLPASKFSHNFDQPDYHRSQHIAQHEALDFLMADFFLHNPKAGLHSNLESLMQWSNRQTISPTE